MEGLGWFAHSVRTKAALPLRDIRIAQLQISKCQMDRSFTPVRQTVNGHMRQAPSAVMLAAQDSRSLPYQGWPTSVRMRSGPSASM